MTKIDMIRGEIDTLLKELETLDRKNRENGETAPGTEPFALSDALNALGELRDRLEAIAEDAGETITEHPVAVAAAAFLLGLAVGRITRHA